MARSGPDLELVLATVSGFLELFDGQSNPKTYDVTTKIRRGGCFVNTPLSCTINMMPTNRLTAKGSGHGLKESGVGSGVRASGRSSTTAGHLGLRVFVL